MDIVRALFVTLAAFTVIFVFRLGVALYRSRSLPPGAHERAAAPGLTHTAIGFVTNSFDTLGIGSFATTTTLYKLLRLVPDERIPGTTRAAFPIMMGSAAFTGMAAAMRFVSSGRYSAPAAIGLTLGGIPAVLIAVWFVQSLALDVVRWGVIVVVLYTALTLMRSAAEERRGRQPVPEVVAV